MAPFGWLVALAHIENALVGQILRTPGFHHGVRKIHRTVQDLKYGCNPDEPLRPGEATEDPNTSRTSFFTHFVDEVKNQIKGTPSDPPPPPPPTKTKQ